MPKIINTQFFKVGSHFMVTGESTHEFKLNDTLVCNTNHSMWQIVGLGRKELTTPSNTVGLTLKNIKGQLPNDGEILVGA